MKNCPICDNNAVKFKKLSSDNILKALEKHFNTTISASFHGFTAYEVLTMVSNFGYRITQLSYGNWYAEPINNKN